MGMRIYVSNSLPIVAEQMWVDTSKLSYSITHFCLLFTVFKVREKYISLTVKVSIWIILKFLLMVENEWYFSSTEHISLMSKKTTEFTDHYNCNLFFPHYFVSSN